MFLRRLGVQKTSETVPRMARHRYPRVDEHVRARRHNCDKKHGRWRAAVWTTAMPFTGYCTCKAATRRLYTALDLVLATATTAVTDAVLYL